ncbi:MAG: hypothetical protein IKV62_10820 [Bacteroidales bacterium]|nr:hypothetical protein [Bacteroidales bacterium]
MKKSLYLGFAALAALAFTACQKEVGVNEPEKKMVTVTLTAQKAGDETKTAAVEEDNKVSYEWTAEDQSNLKLFVVGVDDKGKETLTLVQNPTSSISSDKKILTVTATVEEMSTLRAAISGGWTNDGLKAKVMANQSPLTNNFDPNADVLVSEDVEVDGLNNALLTFKRPVAINKMTLKQLVAGEKIYEVIITSDKNLIGYYEGGKMNGQSGGNSITISYDDIEVGENGEFPVYFVTMPNEGNSLGVVVKSDQFVYSKTFGPVNFSLGKFSKFGVKLPAGEPVVDTDYTGDWVITGVNSNNVYAAQSYVSGNNNLKALGVKLNVDDEEIASTEVDNLKMHFEKITEGDYAGLYTIKDASGNYLYAAGTSGNTSNTLKGTTTLGGADYYWSVEELDGAYTIKAPKSSNNNVMQFNSGSSVFSCYSSASQKPITLYPFSWVVEDAGVQPSGDGSLESPFNVAAAVAFTKALGNNGTSTDAVYIAGIICQVNQTYAASGNYGNATFFISDDGTASGNQFEAYQVLYLNNQKWTSGQTDVKVGDEVIIYGKVTYYNGTTPETVGKGAAYLYSLNGITGNEKYTITVNASTNGTVTASAESATAGTEITLTVTPATNYVLDALTVVDASNKNVTVTDNKFTMPAANVTVTATFKEKPAGATTATITFGSNNVKINAASVTGDDDQGNTWTITTEGTTSFTSNAAYYQVGSSSKPASSITFTTTLPEGTTKVNALSIKLGGFSGTAGDVTLEVDGTTVGTGNLNAANDVTVSSTTSANGCEITITVDNISKGVKVYNIIAEYE